jgi:hypothetical protein
MAPTSAAPSVYQGGNYGELETQAITGAIPAAAMAGARLYDAPTDPSIEMSGSLTGVILARGQAQYRRRERRQRVKSFLWITVSLLAFMTAIAIIVDVLAGDFISSLFKTFADVAG